MMKLFCFLTMMVKVEPSFFSARAELTKFRITVANPFQAKNLCSEGVVTSDISNCPFLDLVHSTTSDKYEMNPTVYRAVVL